MRQVTTGKTVNLVKVFGSVLVFIFQMNMAHATDEYLAVSQGACNHLKNCAKQNMADVPPQYQEMIELSLASMCQSLPSSENIPGFDSSHELYAPAVACMKSITRLSCEDIESEGSATPECEKLGNM